LAKKKILLWLHNGPYSYFHYSIAIELSKLDDYDFYGFVETKKDMEFFQNQKNLEFTELHYFSEKYFDQIKPDLDYLSNLEKKYKLNLWLIAYSERWFNQERSLFILIFYQELNLILY